MKTISKKLSDLALAVSRGDSGLVSTWPIAPLIGAGHGAQYLQADSALPGLWFLVRVGARDLGQPVTLRPGERIPLSDEAVWVAAVQAGNVPLVLGAGLSGTMHAYDLAQISTLPVSFLLLSKEEAALVSSGYDSGAGRRIAAFDSASVAVDVGGYQTIVNLTDNPSLAGRALSLRLSLYGGAMSRDTSDDYPAELQLVTEDGDGVEHIDAFPFPGLPGGTAFPSARLVLPVTYSICDNDRTILRVHNPQGSRGAKSVTVLGEIMDGHAPRQVHYPLEAAATYPSPGQNYAGELCLLRRGLPYQTTYGWARNVASAGQLEVHANSYVPTPAGGPAIYGAGQNIPATTDGSLTGLVFGRWAVYRWKWTTAPTAAGICLTLEPFGDQE